MPWLYGDVVLYRYGRLGQAQFVRVARVISDGPEGLALWIGPDTPQVELVLVGGRQVRSIPVADRGHAPRERRVSTWRGPGIVLFAPAVGEWSVWWFFDEAGDFAGWYGNLEAPRVRWEDSDTRGIDSADRALDIWIEPDHRCTWKDEDEFAALTGLPGRWNADQVPSILSAGEGLMALARSGAPPFDGRWTDYQPDPAWTPVTLPDCWDRPHLANP